MAAAVAAAVAAAADADDSADTGGSSVINFGAVVGMGAGAAAAALRSMRPSHAQQR